MYKKIIKISSFFVLMSMAVCVQGSSDDWTPWTSPDLYSDIFKSQNSHEKAMPLSVTHDALKAENSEQQHIIEARKARKSPF